MGVLGVVLSILSALLGVQSVVSSVLLDILNVLLTALGVWMFYVSVLLQERLSLWMFAMIATF